MGEKPLTTEELRQMAGQPVWCPDEEAYGIVMAMAAVWNLIIISSREG